MAGPIRISILANGRQAKAEMAGVSRSAGAMGSALSRTTKLVAGVFAVSQLKRAAGAVLEVGGSYVSSLNQIQALTGATSSQISKAATQLEASSKSYAKLGLSTGDAAAGMVELTKSGLSLPKALGAIRGTMLLAKAGELEVADASELVANTLNTFNLKAREAADVANSLANAANISSSDVKDIGEAFKYVAPLAAKANVSVDQTNAILAELANQGLKGSIAGTGFRKFLASLQAPAGAAANTLEALGVNTYNAQGKMRPLGAIIDDLNRGMSDLTDAEKNKALKQIFGLTGIVSASVILKNGSKGLAEYTKGVQRAGAAQDLAASKTRGLKGTLDKITASIKSTTESLYRQYSPAVDKALRQDVIPAVKETAKSVLEAVKPIASSLVPVLKLTAQTAGAVVKVLNALPGPVKTIGIEAGIAALVLPRLAAGFAGATTAVRTNVASLRMWGTALADTSTRSTAAGLAMLKLRAAAGAAAGVGGMVALAHGARQSNDALGALELAAGGALIGLSVAGPAGAAVGGLAGSLAGLAKAFMSNHRAAGLARVAAQDFASTLDQSSGAIQRETRELALNALQKAKATSAGQDLGLSTRDLIGATLGQAGATRKVQQAILAGITGSDAQAKAARRLQQVLFGVVGGLDGATVANTGLARSFAEQRAGVIGRTKDLQTYRQVLRGLPKKAFVELKNLNFDPTKAQIVDLTKKYNLTPKQVRTLVQALGTGKARGDILSVRDALAQIHDKSVTLTTTRRYVTSITTVKGPTITRPSTDSLGGLLGGNPRGRAGALFETTRGRTATGSTDGDLASRLDRVIALLEANPEAVGYYVAAGAANISDARIAEQQRRDYVVSGG